MAKIQINFIHSRSCKDGYRVLALPYWPKGLRKNAVDCWARDLAPEPGLLDHRGRGLSPAAYAHIYRNQLRRPCVLNKLKPLALLSLRRRLTLICACPRLEYCHDRLLAEEIESCRKASDFQISGGDCCHVALAPGRPAR